MTSRSDRAPDPLVVEMRKRVAEIHALIEEQERTADVDDRAGMRHREEQAVKNLGRLVIAADSLNALDVLANGVSARPSQFEGALPEVSGGAVSREGET